MATSCTNCGCSKAKCGCQDTMLTSPAACPTPIGCPDPEPCSEVFDAQCSIYTGSDIKCIGSTVIAQNTNVADALSDVVNFFCSYVAELNAGSVVDSCDDYITVTSAIEPISGATVYTVCFDYAYLLDQLPLNEFTAGGGIAITPATVGNVTTYTIDNTDKGSAQFIFKNVAVSGQNTIVADSNNDTLTVEAGSGITLATDSLADKLRIVNSSPNIVQNVFTTFQGTFGTTTANTPTDTLNVLGANGISTSIIGDTLTITSSVNKYVSGGLTGNNTITHNLNTTGIIISVVESTLPPAIAFYPGVDYTYGITSTNQITVNEVVLGALGNYKVTVVG